MKLFPRGLAPRGLTSSSLRCLSRSSLTASERYRCFSMTAPRCNERQWSTPLAKQLGQAIEMTGPVPLASYMRMCLTGDVGGYYTGAIEQGRDQFGQKGDFVTSPEISQIFGELIGIWFVAEWMSQGRPKSGVELIEVGPGRGTLMDDILRTISNFKDMANAIDAIYMVEASSDLRIAQKKLLCGEDRQMAESQSGYHSTCKYGDLPVVWTETVRSIPQNSDKMPFIIAHEFFDALPIHAFQVVNIPPSPANNSPIKPSSPDSSKTGLQWREMVVSPTPPGSTHQSQGTPRSLSHDTPVPDFQLTLSPSSTRHSLYLPESSPRYRALKTIPNAVVEICPDAALYATDFATRIGGSPQHPKARPSGAALILDYGPGDGTGMGIRERAEMLVKGLRQKGAGDEKARDVDRAWRRLVDKGPDGMGKLYKALAILPENDGKRRPVGFGGDVGA
ncbi:NADH dehydrogenase [ubiquinone] complex I, assembly factor 7 [Cytospora mali]|uniref:Protein arginine methyltransferase NDUFAF7 n=1 Tax=Cytospora mali TaxID=578113 RepID=A0A194VKZ2_CYTMA|nr:NADH dehydrogenase [ubiquinone] complex I, assembly factor 7 [Valsa mali]